MKLATVLWIRCSSKVDSEPLIGQLADHCVIYTLDKMESLTQAIHQYQPQLLCFDFDYPDFDSLVALRRTKQQFPSIPVIMMAEHNSESLVIWALRARIWDYFTKPINAQEFIRCIDVISQLPVDLSQPRKIAPLESPVPAQFRVCTRNMQKHTFPAIAYVENHFHEKISLSIVAKHCKMEATTFSHAFKKDNGSTFRDFLLSYRIRKAAELLTHTNACVLEIACAVGFNDHSQFTRIFKRYSDTTPSIFRAEKRSLPNTLPAMPGDKRLKSDCSKSE